VEWRKIEGVFIDIFVNTLLKGKGSENPNSFFTQFNVLPKNGLIQALFLEPLMSGENPKTFFFFYLDT